MCRRVHAKFWSCDFYFASSLENYLNEEEEVNCCVIAFMYSKTCDKRPLTNRRNNALNDKW